ncbi:MaoC/PaaZ C-terminal domain-containing protein [Nocardia crassostreae]|uniref:MaoC/PaaZ C-terminal domain-containing protein n=1 Tax=Nocardia crassostreae TaxID=53428 RepID=UPI000A02207A|nr:MaoC/PaaZ C-terminal domain-containing protein [Nocardia crassostreae]
MSDPVRTPSLLQCCVAATGLLTGAVRPRPADQRLLRSITDAGLPTPATTVTALPQVPRTVPTAIVVEGTFRPRRITNALTTSHIAHPRAAFLVDPSVCENAEQRALAELPAVVRPPAATLSTVEALARVPGLPAPQFALPTHAHWDHVCGLLDLPGLPVHLHRVEHDWVMTGPIAPVGGVRDALRERPSVRRIAGKDLLTITNTFSDPAGAVVSVMHTTVVGITGEDVSAEIGDTIERVIMTGLDASSRTAAADDLPDPDPQAAVRLSDIAHTRAPRTTLRFDDLTVGDELPVRTVRLTRGDLVNYAGVSGDVNPIHWHDGVATLAGLPDVIAHGMLTMGLGAGFVTGWLGDPGALTRYSVRLSNYTVIESAAPGAIEFTGRIKSLDPATRTAVVVIVAKSSGRKVFGLATADVRLA